MAPGTRLITMVILAAMLTTAIGGCVEVRQKTTNTKMDIDVYIDFGTAIDGFSPGIYIWNGTAFEYIGDSSSVIWRYEGVFQDDTSVFDALMAFASAANFTVEYTHYTYGIFVISIAGIENEGDNGKNWQYWVNGRYGEVACDKKMLNDGDRVEWRYAGNPFV